MQDMNDILDLVRTGRLTEATSAIRESLQGGPAPAAAAGSPPMKDVTPRPRALPMPGPVPGPVPQADARRAAREARPATSPGAMERRPGPVPYRLFRPARPVATAPLVVMLHGCTQSPEDFAAGTRMNAAADRIGAHVVWPEQARGANPNLCWNWFDPASQGRTGEAAAIAEIALRVAAEVAPQASGLHVAGLSAGGAMAAILGAAYPDVFASVGIHSGLPAGAAHDVATAFAAMRSGGSAAGKLSGRPFGASSIPASSVPAIVFHGDADRTVAPANGAAIAMAARTGVKPRRRTLQEGGRRVTVTRIETATGRPASELWAVEGLGHAWSGGDAGGSYADPSGPDATGHMLRFFAEVDRA